MKARPQRRLVLVLLAGACAADAGEFDTGPPAGTGDPAEGVPTGAVSRIGADADATVDTTRSTEAVMGLPDVVRRWVAVFHGTLDMEEYLDLFTDDVVFRDGESGRMVRGRQQLADLVQPFTRPSGPSANVLSWAVNGDTVLLEGELHAQDPAGRPVVTRGAAVFTLEGGSISSAAMYMFRRNIAL